MAGSEGRGGRARVILGGLALIGLAAVLLSVPVASLAGLVLLVGATLVVLGVEALLRARRDREGAAAWIGGAALAAAGVGVLVRPGVTVGGVATLTGVGLLAAGLLRVAGQRRSATGRWGDDVLEGAATALIGAVALVWPDVTILVVVVLIGLRTAMAGIRRVVDGIRPPRSRGPGTGGHADTATAEPDPARPRTRLRTVARSARAVLVLVGALALLAASTSLRDDRPTPDAFTDAPAAVPARPGVLLRDEPFDRALPPAAVGRRILHTWTAPDGSTGVASGLVVLPADPGPRPLPVIAWAHGTTGVARHCAPSLLPDPFTAGAMPALAEVIDRGWAVVATDYPGLGAEGDGHPYLVGEPAGRAVLDAVRAARQLDGVDLADDVVVWGHSQGGGAALWAGALATGYAPDAGVVGVAAMAPASDLLALVDGLGDVPAGSIFAGYAITGYATAYEDVVFDDYVRTGARLTVQETAGRCLAERPAIVSVIESLVVDEVIWSRDPTTGPLGRRLRQNVPTGRIDVPLLLAQGSVDQLVRLEVQTAYVASRCAAGQVVDYRTYPGMDHVPLVEEGSPLIPELLRWTADRFAGWPAGPGIC